MEATMMELKMRLVRELTVPSQVHLPSRYMHLKIGLRELQHTKPIILLELLSLIIQTDLHGNAFGIVEHFILEFLLTMELVNGGRM